MRYPLLRPAVFLGQGEGCDVWAEEADVAERHARIERRPDGYHIVALTPTGMLVNDVPAAEAPLRDGDHLRLGEAVFRFVAAGGAEAAFYEEMHRLAHLDPLTEVANRGALMAHLGRELRRAQRYRRPLALLLFDIDHFRAFNNNFGHLCGDFVLRELARCVRDSLRGEDLLGRYGGEECAVVLPETDLVQALQAAERLRARVEGHSFVYQDRAYRVTLSLGVTATPGGQALTPEQFLRHAGARLRRGSLHHAQGEWQQALADYDAAAGLDPDCADARAWRGTLLYNLGDHDRALAELDEALRLDLAHVLARFSRANVRLHEGDVEGALADHDEALRLDPGCADALFGRSNARHRKGDYTGAVADADAAFRLDRPGLFPSALVYTTLPRGPGRPRSGGAAVFGHLVRVAPLGPELGTRHPLNAPACGLRGGDQVGDGEPVLLQRQEDGYQVLALPGSGRVAINGIELASGRLAPGDVLSVGDDCFLLLAGAAAGIGFFEEVYRCAHLDRLTGLPGRRYASHLLERELGRCQRQRRPLALLILAADYFKSINLHLGLPGGDHVLHELGQCVRAGVGRAEGTVARVAGVEFAVILPGAGLEQAREVAERLRRRVETNPFAYQGETVRLTVSAGVAATDGADEWASRDALQARAGQFLLQAKSLGRNTCICG
jgi:diguanylate cyclase (GGDEF)-like protein